MVWFLLLLMVTACDASADPLTEDLGDSVMVFLKPTDTDYAKLFSSVSYFTALTVCLRAKTDLCRDHALFSGATSSHDNACLIYWDESKEELEVYVNGHKIEFKGLKYKLNKWHSICVTWDYRTGAVQLWIDGHRTVQLHTSVELIHDPCFILGQEQDAVEGSFEQRQSFVGEICDVHVWDYVLEACEIQHYLDYENFCPGNAVNWRNLKYYIVGDAVVVADKQICTQENLDYVCPQLPGSYGYKYYGIDDGYYGDDSPLEKNYYRYKYPTSYNKYYLRYYGKKH